MTAQAFGEWVRNELDLTAQETEAIRLQPAFEVLLSRIEAARRRRAVDPLVTITSKRAGGNSRDATKRMLLQLGYTPAQRRAMHRLLAGSPSGWPGLLRLFVRNESPTDAQRGYARSQVAAILRADPVRCAAAAPAPGVR